MAQNNTANTEQDLNEILRLRREKLAALKSAGNDPYTVTKYDFDSDSETIKNNYDGFEGKTVKIAGRIMSRRIMGKASFVGLADCSGKIQLYVRRDDVGEEEYAAFKKWDIGDIIGVEGFVFKTQTGEISVHSTNISLLSKSLLPLPEKFHGLKAVSYTHLTLPTNREVEISGVAGSFKKKKKRRSTKNRQKMNGNKKRT